MDAVAEQLFLELSDLRAQRAQHRQLRTLQGRYFNVVGHFLSVYGLYRVVMAAVNTALRRVGKIDPGTRCVQIAVDWLGLPLDAQVWTQHVSFILVGTAWPVDPVPPHDRRRDDCFVHSQLFDSADKGLLYRFMPSRRSMN